MRTQFWAGMQGSEYAHTVLSMHAVFGKCASCKNGFICSHQQLQVSHWINLFVEQCLADSMGKIIHRPFNSHVANSSKYVLKTDD